MVGFLHGNTSAPDANCRKKTYIEIRKRFGQKSAIFYVPILAKIIPSTLQQ